MTKIAICGGHLTPALALIEQLQKRKDTEVVFFGRQYSAEGNKNPSAEYIQVNSKDINFIKITAGKLQRKFTKHTIPALLKIPLGFIQAFFYLILERPQVVVSFGGYLSAPVVICAWLLGIDSITHEQATIPGLATRINSLFAKRVFLTWPQTQSFFPKEKSQVIGNLTRKSLIKTEAADKRLREFLKTEGKMIFVTGGNLGSHFLNKLTREIAPKLKEFSFVHQVGTADFQGDIEKSKKIKSRNYFTCTYLDAENIGAVYKRADIVISRSGANTVWDVAQLKKAAIFIPLPIAASNEQFKNAKVLQKAGSAEILMQKETDAPKLKKTISHLFQNIAKYQKNADEFAKTLPQNSTEEVIKFLSTYK